jgi:hypothetical protein
MKVMGTGMASFVPEWNGRDFHKKIRAECAGQEKS